jgi:hypothetical protein
LAPDEKVELLITSPISSGANDGPHVGEFHYLDLLIENQERIKKWSNLNKQAEDQ